MQEVLPKKDFYITLQEIMDTLDSYDEQSIPTEKSGFTVILDNSNTEQAQYQDAPLFAGQTLAIRTPNDDTTVRQNITTENSAVSRQKTAPDRASNSARPKAKKYVPEQIRRMKNLYQYGDGSFRQQCKNFYVQGKFMENYEDNAPWIGEIYEYWPSYHNLSLAQLRGYFTWRTELRKGNYQKNCDAFVLMYLSELFNGIGAVSAEESFHKIQEFKESYIDSGLSTGYIRYNIQQWMFDFAVVNGLDTEIAYRYAARQMLERDSNIEILRNPEKYSDKEIFNALCLFSGRTPDSSIVIQKDKETGIYLFAAVWRLASAQYRQGEKELFELCFGIQYSRYWNPLNNTLYYSRGKQKTVIYELNSCRKYSFQNNIWHEYGYHKWYDGQQHITELLHEADRRFRLYLKTGRPLKERKEEAWAIPYIEAVIGADRKAKLEAARPKISIDFSGLDKIRKDALETQDSLLTEEETMGSPEAASKQTENSKHTGTPEYDGDAIPDAASIPIPAAVPSTASMPSAAVPSDSAFVQSVPSGVSVPLDGLLDGMQIQLLQMLLRGEPVQELITAQHGMPSVIADAINEALFDLIGDTVVECDGETITLVEDYRGDVASAIGEDYPNYCIDNSLYKV